MENDSKKELARLKRKLSAMNRETEEILQDIPIEVVQEPSAEEETPVPESAPEEPAEDLEEAILQGRRETEEMLRRKDRRLIGLMLAVSLLCAGITGVMIYWLEVYLK